MREGEPVASARARVDASRKQMEERYANVESQQHRLRRLAVEIRAKARAREVPDWLNTDAVQLGILALAADARGEGEPSRIESYVPLSVVLPDRAPRWALWGRVVTDRARAFAVVDARLSPADILSKAILVVADTPTPDAWDGWFQDDPVVAEWSARNKELEIALRIESASRPTQLVRLEKGRLEVGPWEGWTYDLGAKDNKRAKVSFSKPLHVDRHEVTCAQYHAYLLGLDAAERGKQLPHGWELNGDVPVLPPDRADHPITGVTFLQARAYASSLGKRLPSEDECERSAAGGDESRRFPWGSDPKGRTWVHGREADAGPEPVATHPDDVTPEGVLGMAGNVKEMVATYSDRKPVKGRVKPEARIVVRGGGFRTRTNECQTRWRWFVEAAKSGDDVGFRCVMDDAEFRRRGSR